MTIDSVSDYNLKSIKEEFKKKGIFYTPNELAEYINSLIDVETDEVYDPTCGRGSLLSVFGDDVSKYGQDINAPEVQVAIDTLKRFTGAVGDTLTEPAFADRKFKAIVANPPFSIKWTHPKEYDERFADAPTLPPENKADYVFLLHILHYLNDEGVAVVINFPGILYRGNREGKIRQWMVERNYIDKVISIPGGTFVDTNIETCVLVLRKNKADNQIEFVDRKNKLSRLVALSEIAENDFLLSVSRYVAPEIKRVKHNPIDLEHRARKNLIARLEAELKMSKFVSHFEGLDFGELLAEIRKLIDVYENKWRLDKYGE